MPRPAARGRSRSPLPHWRSAAAAPPPRAVRLLTSSRPRPAPDGHRAPPIRARPAHASPNGDRGRAAGSGRPRAIGGKRLSDGSAPRCPARRWAGRLSAAPANQRPRSPCYSAIGLATGRTRRPSPAARPMGARAAPRSANGRGGEAGAGGGRGALRSPGRPPPLRCAPRAAEGPARRRGSMAIPGVRLGALGWGRAEAAAGSVIRLGPSRSSSLPVPVSLNSCVTRSRVRDPGTAPVSPGRGERGQPPDPWGLRDLCVRARFGDFPGFQLPLFAAAEKMEGMRWKGNSSGKPS
ncbi:translation initiation factor IF-2-like [Vidua macroura]|uniref:translation initiation factor IF-2-like n=1 Tax=Vidua macroura TaxID=187451 RepID=UPI0023A8F369|nr:translation initiation factor IF-2-like [Vidua macroura]